MFDTQIQGRITYDGPQWFRLLVLLLIACYYINSFLTHTLQFFEKNIIHRMSWFVVYLVFVLVLTIVATAVLYGMSVFKNSNIGLIYLLFLLYDMSVLALAFLMTPFFDKARVCLCIFSFEKAKNLNLFFSHFQVAGIFGAMAVSFLNLFYYIQFATGDDHLQYNRW